jgi:hypothetical protein
MFILGKNNFRIKSCTPFELGLSRNPDSGFTIEIRQNYFHLLGIPFFDVGMSWHIRKGPTLNAMPEPYRQQIDEKKLRISTPWRTFTGPILIMLSLVIYNVNDVWERKQNSEKEAARTIKSKQILEEQKPDISETTDFRFEKAVIDSLNK